MAEDALSRCSVKPLMFIQRLVVDLAVQDGAAACCPHEQREHRTDLPSGRHLVDKEGLPQASRQERRVVWRETGSRHSACPLNAALRLQSSSTKQFYEAMAV